MMVLSAPITRHRAGTSGASGERSYWMAMAFACLVFAITVAGFVSRPGPDGSVAVVVSPQGGERQLMQTLAASDAILARQSRLSWLAIATPRRAISHGAFRSALRSAGALVLLHPAVLAGCFDDFPPTLADFRAQQRTS